MNLRGILKSYRKLQYAICGRSHIGVMQPGELCTHDPYEQDINHGDVVHPCVRYIPNGYEGYNWWMVYTPYYQSNDKTENPILCFSTSKEHEFPTHWHIYCQVQGQPLKGYNSDPALLYANNSLYVFWRENLTKRCEQSGYARATFGGVVKDGQIKNVFGPVVGTEDIEEDHQTSPEFLQDNDGSFRCLAMHLTFHAKWPKRLPTKLYRIVEKLFLASDLAGIWSQQKSHGLAQWRSQSIDGQYLYEETVKFLGKNKLYRPWHIDFFEWQNKLYALVQTNQCNADICLAVSEDRKKFAFFKRPLMTNETCGKVGIYKPTGGVIDGIFYLYYTAQDWSNRSLNKLYLTTMDFNKLLERIQ